MEYYYNSKELYDLATSLLCALEVPKDHAKIVSSVLVDTSLDGVDTHGLSCLTLEQTPLPMDFRLRMIQ